MKIQTRYNVLGYNIIMTDPDIEVIDVARNGEDALEKILRLKPDVVTLDVEMPVMDGIQALQKIMEQSP